VTPDINSLLDEVREELGKQLPRSEAKLSPKSPETAEVGAHSHLAGEPGVGEADNISDAGDAVDKFLANLVAQLMVKTGMGEDEAFDYVFDFFDTTTGEGHLPPLPDEDADPEEQASWLGKAGTLGVSAQLLKAASGG